MDASEIMINDAKICYEYLYLDTKSAALSNSISYVLTGFNYILRTIVIIAVTWVGYATETE